MSQAPLVSVIMNCLNCEKYLREALDTVYAQTYSSWEIVFWDNASTDGSSKIVQEYDTRLRYFRGEHTVPLGAARNLAMQQARGDFIAFLDCDDLWMATKLEGQIPLFEDPQVGLVFSDSIVFNNGGEKCSFLKDREYCTENAFSKLLTDYFLDIETVVIRRAVLDQEKLWFDERFELVEDAEFFTRIAYQWKLAMVPKPLAQWRIHADSWTRRKNHLSGEETMMMLEKYYQLFPDFARRFAAEIHLLEAHVTINRAKHLWKNGQTKAARNHLSPYIFKRKKALLLYLLTFFPEPLVHPIISKFRKNLIMPD